MRFDSFFSRASSWCSILGLWTSKMETALTLTHACYRYAWWCGVRAWCAVSVMSSTCLCHSRIISHGKYQHASDASQRTQNIYPSKSSSKRKGSKSVNNKDLAASAPNPRCVLSSSKPRTSRPLYCLILIKRRMGVNNNTKSTVGGWRAMFGCTAEALALYRISVGVLLVCELVLRFRFLHVFYTDEG